MPDMKHPSSPTRIIALLLSLAVTAVSPAFADGDDLYFFSYPDGQPIRLIKSERERAVELPAGVITETRAAIERDRFTKIVPIPGAEHRLDRFIVRFDKGAGDPAVHAKTIPGVVETQAVFRTEGSDQPVLSSGNVAVKLRPDLTRIEREQFFSQFRVTVVRVIDPENNVFLVQPLGDPEDADVLTAMGMFRDDRTVFAQPDFIVPAELYQVFTQVQDEFFERQWYLNNVGQELGTPGADVNVEGAWEFTFGEDVLVGMFDDSVDMLHEDLVANFKNVSHDPFTGTESPTAAAPLGPIDAHGTAVMGLIVGDANEVGIRGVAPASRFTASRGLNDLVSLAQMASAYTFARQQNVDVHNNSWGFPNTPNSAVGTVVDAIRTSYSSGRGGRGMVILFAAGNSALELGPDDDLATLPEVIGVVASNANDELSGFSNFGADIDIAAPSGDAFLPDMLTTDVQDSNGFPSFGYNDGSGFDVFGTRDLPNPNYTQNFSGTSASCPVASGVAALVLSQNSDLTAEQVRTILLHTAVKIDPVLGQYHPITQRSLLFGYGRIDATAAVEAARQSADNGGFTWPEPIRSVEVRGNVLTWAVGDRIREIDQDNNPDTPALELGDTTVRTLVVESRTPFSAAHAFIPEDGESFSVGDEPVSGITVVQNNANTAFTLPSDGVTRFYALFSSNAIGRYGFGVAIDTEGNVEGVPGAGGGSGGNTIQQFQRPVVSIDVSPLSGVSPLRVDFKGNALTNRTIESVEWDFDDGTSADQAQTSHIYTVPDGQTRRFFPTLTITDDLGNTGSRTIALDVRSPNMSGFATVGDIRITIAVPGSVRSDVSRGESPFTIQLSISGTLASDQIDSVRWDLGDGSTATTLAVPHTYINNSQFVQTLPISVEVTTRDANGQLITQSATRFITVEPDPTAAPVDLVTGGNAVVGDAGDAGDAGETTNVDASGRLGFDACGAGSSLALISLLAMPFFRRRLF